MDKTHLILSLRKHGFSEEIITAFEHVAREDFVPEHWREHAYDDIPLEIGQGQTISQPYTIAFMLSLLELEKGYKILEVGSGSGYVLALLNELAPDSEIYGVERLSALVNRSKRVLRFNKKIRIFKKDGS